MNKQKAQDNNIKVALGLMSGTSVDGIDAALIKSDGHDIMFRGQSCYLPYQTAFKEKIKNLINNQLISLKYLKEIELELTRYHIEAVKQFLDKYNMQPEELDIIGFHGHSVLHFPEQSISWQIGNPQLLSSQTKVSVVADFRTKNIIYGGQGAPLLPSYHYALFKDIARQQLILNIGGVANITYLDSKEDNMIAFDIGFGNAPFDDLLKAKTGRDLDEGGQLASQGKINYDLANKILASSYFNKPPPKSLDRNQFNFNECYNLKLEDALATLAYILALTLKAALSHLPLKPQEIIVCGGGRKNLAIIEQIKKVIGGKVIDIDQIEVRGAKINGDMVEAEGFAFLAIRCLLDLPFTFPKTTGPAFSSAVKTASGGVIYYP